ncbi:MAG: type VI secretion system tip protein TssI/VgrG, partial [Planctomycetota bacterium]
SVEGGTRRGPTYTNTFVAAPLDAGPVRPPLLDKPRPRGIESATVVGPEGEEVHTDALGRVRVRFHWDDAAPGGAGQTCWLRVLSPWAGPGYGASFIPRVGMEVVVDFLGGDPDRPVVTGCLYTGTNLPPGALPQSKTCTTLRSQSTPSEGEDRQGFNELRFEDAAGREEVFLHAERNQRTVVRASQSTQVGASRSLNVAADSKRTVGGTESVQIGGGDSDEPGDLDVKVAGSERRTIEQDHELNVLKTAIWRVEESLVANATVGARISCDDTGSSLTLEPTSAVLEATKSIELRVGNTSLKLTPKGITMQGEVISANVERQLWLASEAGRVSLNDKGAEVFGGAKSESVLRLRAQSLEAKAKGLLKQSGKGVLVTGKELVNLEADETKVVGFSKTTVKSGGPMEVDAVGRNDIKGKPINLN